MTCGPFYVNGRSSTAIQWDGIWADKITRAFMRERTEMKKRWAKNYWKPPNSLDISDGYDIILPN